MLLVTLHDSQKPAGLLDLQMAALRLFNAEALRDLRIVILCQGTSAERAQLMAASRGVEAVTFVARDPEVGGVGIWDLMSALADIVAQYGHDQTHLVYVHQEMIFGPGWFDAARHATRGGAPIILGNLRRVARDYNSRVHWTQSSDPTLSALLSAAITTNNEAVAREALRLIPSVPWTQRTHPGWKEDIFLANLDWLRAIKFFDHERGRLPFQDVFDLVGETIRLLPEALRPRVEPLGPQAAIYHLAHPKGYLHFTDEVLAWFRSDLAMWGDTLCSDVALWRRLQSFQADRDKAADNPLVYFRRAPGGTCERFGRALQTYLAAGGLQTLQLYVESHPASVGHVQFPQGRSLRVAVVCPGPSGRDATLDGYDLVIAVNRAALWTPCDVLVALDAHTWGWIAQEGGPLPRRTRPTICTGTAQYLQMRDMVAETVHYDHLPATPGSLPVTADLRWEQKSALLAIEAAARLGAVTVDVYGMDWEGEADADGFHDERQKRTPARWDDERRLYGRLRDLLASRGVKVQRKVPEGAKV